MILLPGRHSVESRITGTVLTGSYIYLSCTAVLAGSKRLWIVSAEAKYDRQSRQEARDCVVSAEAKYDRQSRQEVKICRHKSSLAH